CLVELAERLFALPVRLAAPRGPVGMPEEISQPEYATAVGLLMYGARAHRQAAQRPATLMAKFKSMFAGAEGQRGGRLGKHARTGGETMTTKEAGIHISLSEEEHEGARIKVIDDGGGGSNA